MYDATCMPEDCLPVGNMSEEMALYGTVYQCQCNVRDGDLSSSPFTYPELINSIPLNRIKSRITMLFPAADCAECAECIAIVIWYYKYIYPLVLSIHPAAKRVFIRNISSQSIETPTRILPCPV